VVRTVCVNSNTLLQNNYHVRQEASRYLTTLLSRLIIHPPSFVLGPFRCSLIGRKFLCMPLFMSTGRENSFPSVPQRIISHGPSHPTIVMISVCMHKHWLTKFCVHPATLFPDQNPYRGTKAIKPDLIRHCSLEKEKNDLIIANTEEEWTEAGWRTGTQFPYG